MCPLRFILLFFSAVLAAYFAWKTVAAPPQPDSTTSSSDLQQQNTTSTSTSTIQKQQLNYFLKSHVENGLWVLIDMASGRYLWRNIKQFKTAPASS